ncbi:GNAT family N-acetyltransferase [Spartinivicinus ruber]|uniref:GNAT family N-acetyltransferase n=1 Tax=Spartinivicinus ruber TaxID=2683272 RepID=UPI0013D17800|nr:GNAT family N-acetyltransferase [Spartinivicinus ruber]
MIVIRKMTEYDATEVKSLSVEESQLAYVGHISEILCDDPATNHFHVILDNENIVGFFIIDTLYKQHYSFTLDKELGLRGFIIDKNQQGKGLGKQSVIALKPYLQLFYQKWDSIVLTVNCKNINAYKCYLTGGFTDTGQLYQEGPAGPQHIMRMNI